MTPLRLYGPAILCSAVFLGACATTVDTSVVIPAQKPDAGVERISVQPVKNSITRNEQPEITSELSDFLFNIEVKGEKKFDVRNTADLLSVQEVQAIERGSLRGSIDQNTVSILQAQGVEALVITNYKVDAANEPYYIEADGRQVKCDKRVVTATLYPKIIRVSDARTVFQGTYTGDASKTSCTGPITGGNEMLAKEARESAFSKMRLDIAPSTQKLTATILTNYCGPKKLGSGLRERLNEVTKGSPCDNSAPPQQVVDLIVGGSEFIKSGRMDRGCERFDRAASQHNEGFIIPYLLGVCAEVYESDLNKALALYEDADQETNEPVKAINEALTRIRQKFDSKGLQARAAEPKAKPDPVVRAVQQRLLDEGYDPGPADGFMGSKTGDALKLWQEDYGIDVTGTINDATKREMGIQSI